VRQTELDGIPVFLADGPPPLTAGLVFGVGRRDEDVVHGGLTHLVEHLVMRAVGRTTLDANASVDLTATEFTASGPAERVRAFLAAVCGALAELPVERLAVEADVLRAEGGTVAPPPVAILLGELFGTAGAGLAAMGDPALRSLTAEDVGAWCRRWFHRGNAALWLSGPLPEGLRLPLPEGPAPDRAPQHRLEPATPAWGEAPLEGSVVLGAEVRSHPALRATVGILRTRVEEELRHRRGLAYAVQADVVCAAEGDSCVPVVWTDVRPGHEIAAIQVVWRALSGLADEGPAAAEVEQERAEVEELLDDPRSGTEEARALAHARVTGVPARTAEDLRRQAGLLTRQAVRAVAADLHARAVLLVPEGTEVPVPGLSRLASWSPEAVDGRVFAPRRLRGVPRGARLVVGEEGASLVLAPDRRVTVLWQDAVGFVRLGPGEWQLMGRGGLGFPVVEADWRDGAEALARIRSAVPAELQVVSDDARDDGLVLLRAPAHRVAEAVALGRRGATVVAGGEWTAVLPDADESAEAFAAGLSAAVGRGTIGLLLRRTHVDVEYVLLRGGQVVDAHRWAGAPGDALLLARATGRPEADTARLLGLHGPPEEVLGHVVATLGLPLEVPALLDGAPPVEGRRVEGRGLAGGLRASVRGDFLAPEGSGGALDSWLRLSRDRPGWYRGLNALGALVCVAVLAAVLAGVPDGTSRVVVGVVSTAGLLSFLWEARPARRPDREAPVRGLTPAG
jgi:predicted Zn-dependent peptidase